MKKGIIAIVIIILVILGFYFINKSKDNYQLKLPEKDKVVSIKIENNFSVKTISLESTIKEILAIIDNNYETNVKSINDSPTSPDTLIKITFNYEEEVATFIYAYTRNGKYYLEQPYNGIYEINQDVFEKLENYLN